jgi:hypothetical protein
MRFRIPMFVLGLLFGLLIGLIGGFVLQTIWDFSSNDFEIPLSDSKPNDTTKDKKVRPKSKSSSESGSETIVSADSLLPSDELASIDSTYDFRAGYNGDDIIVATDELIFIRIINVIGDSLSKGGKNLDSLLIGEKGNYGPQRKYRVEFWKSPINYRGYRLQKDRLVIFGIEEYNEAILRRVDSRLYLMVGSKAYLLEENADYQSLNPVRLP